MLDGVTGAGIPEALVAGWWDYTRRARGSRDDRKGLEMGEPTTTVAAYERVSEIVREVGGPEAVALVLALLDSAPSPADLVDVAAGPLEDLLAEHWDEVIDEIEAAARRGGPIRRALTSVYLTGPRETRLRRWME
jgi:hypothetical protein